MGRNGYFLLEKKIFHFRLQSNINPQLSNLRLIDRRREMGEKTFTYEAREDFSMGFPSSYYNRLLSF